ncbi:hypothetical protein [Bradyrhizobium liaoningense]|uniref:hypothetical protein n=1 Tax=Bradyrhizobium liaoningense TaxID=43992 RepID=UPI0032DEC98D
MGRHPCWRRPPAACRCCVDLGRECDSRLKEARRQRENDKGSTAGLNVPPGIEERKLDVLTTNPCARCTDAEFDTPFRKRIGEGCHDGSCAAAEPHRRRRLSQTAVTLRRPVRHPLKDDVTVVVLAKAGEPEIGDQSAECRLHLGPEPGGTEIEPVARGFTGLVHRPDTTA